MKQDPKSCPPQQKQRAHTYRSVFLSDFHIGAKSFDAEALVKFLDSFDAQYLYLVGDIIDGWKLNKRWHWTEGCSRVLEALIEKAQSGTRIIYLPGNHDEQVRHIPRNKKRKFEQRLGVQIRERVVHTLADGRRFLILHGDQFDHKIIKGALSRWSDQIYDFFLERFGAHNPPPQILVKGALKPFSLAKALGRHGQSALHLLGNFEKAVHSAVQQRGLDGLICGHTHIPAIKQIRTITYANCGSWLRGGHTALIENHNGYLKLIDWPSSATQPQPLFEAQAEQAPASPYSRALAQSLVQTIHKLWPEKKDNPARPSEWIEIEGRDLILRRMKDDKRALSETLISVDTHPRSLVKTR
jgi:UDP-2,3-diacylglucosamine pyrophosphatase LpxH